MDNIIELPDLLPYPIIQSISDVKELDNKFCYILKHYPNCGIQMLIVRDKGQVCLRLADWNAKDVNPLEKNNAFLEQVVGYSQIISSFMKYAGIPKALYYFSNDLGTARLVDMRLSINKFCGKAGVPVQERVGDPIILNKENIDLIMSGSGVYVHNKYIVKPSVFKFIVRGEEVFPMYGNIFR